MYGDLDVSRCNMLWDHVWSTSIILRSASASVCVMCVCVCPRTRVRSRRVDLYIIWTLASNYVLVKRIWTNRYKLFLRLCIDKRTVNTLTDWSSAKCSDSLFGNSFYPEDSLSESNPSRSILQLRARLTAVPQGAEIADLALLTQRVLSVRSHMRPSATCLWLSACDMHTLVIVFASLMWFAASSQ